MVQVHPQTVAEDGSKGGIEERRPVAAKLDAETATGKARPDGYHPVCIIMSAVSNLLKFFFISVQRIILLDGAPRKFRDFLNGKHIDYVLVTTLHLREAVCLVTHIYLKDVITDVHVQIFLGQSKVSRRTFHITFHAARICRTLHKNLSCSQE